MEEIRKIIPAMPNRVKRKKDRSLTIDRVTIAVPKGVARELREHASRMDMTLSELIRFALESTYNFKMPNRNQRRWHRRKNALADHLRQVHLLGIKKGPLEL